MNEFRTIEGARRLAEKCPWTHNNERPSMEIGGTTPTMKFRETMSRKKNSVPTPAKNRGITGDHILERFPDGTGKDGHTLYL